MKKKPRTGSDQEPMGLVISRGARSEPAPVVFAYVWGPAPELNEAPTESKVA